MKITGRQMHVSEDTRDFIEEKAGRFERFFDRITSVQVTVSHQKENIEVEFVVHAARLTIVGKDVEEEVHVAVDRAAYKVERKLKKLKAKFNEYRAKKGTTIPAEEGEEEEDAFYDDILSDLRDELEL